MAREGQHQQAAGTSAATTEHKQVPSLWAARIRSLVCGKKSVRRCTCTSTWPEHNYS